MSLLSFCTLDFHFFLPIFHKISFLYEAVEFRNNWGYESWGLAYLVTKLNERNTNNSVKDEIIQSLKQTIKKNYETAI